MRQKQVRDAILHHIKASVAVFRTVLRKLVPNTADNAN